MNRLMMVLIAFAVSMAILVPAGSAAAATESTPTAPVSSSADCLFFCFTFIRNDVVEGIGMDIFAASVWCGVPPAQLQALSVGQVIRCPITGRALMRVK